MKLQLKRTLLISLFLLLIIAQTSMGNISAAAQAEEPAKVTSLVINGRIPYPADVPFMVVMYGSSDVIDLVDIHGNRLNRIDIRQLIPDAGISNAVFPPDCGELIVDGNIVLDIDGNIVRQWPEEENIDLSIRATNFSPAGNRVAYLSLWFDNGYYALYGHGDLVVRNWPDLSNWIQLTHNGGSAPNPGYWSPDGDRIAFTDFDENGILELYVYTFSTGITLQVTHNIYEDEINRVYWLPDDQTVIYRIHNRDTEEYSPSLMSWNAVSGETAAVSDSFISRDDLITEFSREFWLDDGVTGLSVVAAQTESGQEWIYSTWFDIQTREVIQQIVLQPSEPFYEEINYSYYFFLLNDYTIGGIASPNSLIEFNLATGIAQPWYVTDMPFFPMEMPPAAINNFYTCCLQQTAQ